MVVFLTAIFVVIPIMIGGVIYDAFEWKGNFPQLIKGGRKIRELKKKMQVDNLKK